MSRTRSWWTVGTPSSASGFRSAEPVVSGGYGNYTFDWDCSPGLDTNQINYIPHAAGAFDLHGGRQRHLWHAQR